ncbi:MAG: hypothetical protein J7J96_05195, partial [Sulfurimonas sp.]|nr:hypothetical protein [Sulfurimonas sp.]
YILTNQDELHKVKMRNSVKIHTFLVWAKPLFIDKNSRSVVTFTDVTELEDAYIALDEKEDIMIAQSRHAAMGEMISMIAYQWRQPISVIAMGANNILADIELDSVDEVTLRKGAKKIVDQTQENMIIRIYDTGRGIKEEIMNKIFNPYFSTKNSNVGTGIGLYMSKTIIEKHLHGILRAYNFGNGVCFEISLPLNIKDSGELDG